jgi:type II secretory pathway component GspD/PulD (secretin)
MNLKKKLAVFLAILFSLNLFAQAPGETITISFQNIPLSEAIKKIESVSKYTFFYDALKLNVDQKVSLNAQKTPIQQAISQMLGNSGIKFEIKQSQIILSDYPFMHLLYSQLLVCQRVCLQNTVCLICK